MMSCLLTSLAKPQVAPASNQSSLHLLPTMMSCPGNRMEGRRVGAWQGGRQGMQTDQGEA